MTEGSPVETVLARLTAEIVAVLDAELHGLYGYGSYVGGDFAPERSDLDLLAVLHSGPTEGMVESLVAMHDAVATDHPSWRDRVEVEYVSGRALHHLEDEDHAMARISPGEPLHLVPVTRHYLLNWYSARHQGVTLVGAEAGDVLPDFTREQFRQVLGEHVAQWPDWVTEMSTTGQQSYAVLTLCRSLYAAREGEQVSKRHGAGYAVRQLPEWAPLIEWARAWWYEKGSDTEPDRLPDVTAFVDHVVPRILKEL